MKAVSKGSFSIKRLRNYIFGAMILGIAAYTAATYVLVSHIFASFGPAVRHDLEWKVQRGASELARAADLALAVSDADMVKEAFGVYATSEDVLALVATDPKGTVVAKHGPAPEDNDKLFGGPAQKIRDEGDYLVTWASATIEGKEVGKMAVVVTTKRLRDAEHLGVIISTATIIAGVIGLVFGLFVIGFFARVVMQRDKQLEEYAATLEQRVEERTRELDERNRGMRLVLDNVAQGFVTIDAHGVMAPERSAIVDTWFGTPEPGATFDGLVEPLATKFVESFRMGLEAIRDNVLPVELLLDQMPKRFSAEDKTFQMSYTPIVGQSGDVERLLLVNTDVTAQVTRERMEREQRQVLTLFQKIAADKKGFQGFFEESSQIVSDLATPGDPIVEKRLIHTLKGNCGIYGVENMVELTHHIETEMAERESGAMVPADREAIRAAWAGVEEKVHQLLGSSRRDVVEIESGDLHGLIYAISNGASTAQVAATLRSWKNEVATRPLARLGDHAKALASRLGKGDLAVKVEGSSVRLDSGRWAAFWSNLVHAVRNAVDHGIEDAATRAALGKPERGEILLTASTAGGQLVITLADDGRGVDWDKVRAKAEKAGLPTATQRDLVEAIFTDGLSTRDTATATSGRGVGLSALRQAVRELGGSVDVLSETGVGSKFVFRFVATQSIQAAPVASTPATTRN